MSGCRVSLAISSTLCVNRPTSGPTTKVEEEIDTLESRSQLYLSLGPGPKTTAVGRKQIDARHEHALVTVTNEQTLDLLVGAAESAGLVVDVVESSLVALSRLHGQLDPEDESAVVLAQLDEDRFEIGVSRRGQLLLEYRPTSDATTAKLGQIVDAHHDRLVRFCQRQYGVGRMDLSRLWLVGNPEEVSATNARTEKRLATGVLPLDVLSRFWDLEKCGPITAEMGAALGLALRGRIDEVGVSPNLMEKIHASAKAPLRPILIRSVAPIAATLLVAACLWAVNLEQRMELSALRAEVDQVAPLELRGQRLSKTLRDADVEVHHLRRLAAKTPHRGLDQLVGRLAQCLPEDVWLSDLRLADPGQLTLAGVGYTEGGVYDFVRHLENAPGFNEVALRGTDAEQTSQGPATSFHIDIDLAPAPLAAREASDE